ncbi:MAG TPA: hypothetical protein VIQ03_07385 [Gammaproteobacteria bacterium]
MKTRTIFLSFTLAAMASPLQADSLTIPNTFTAGSPAVAAEVNANFDAVKSSVDDNDARITTNANNINSQSTTISTNTSNISNNATNILGNTTAITNLDTAKQNRVEGICSPGSSIRAVNADGSVICELDNDSGGDIQSVIAGGGLYGGGASGTVTLSLRSGSVSIPAMALIPYSHSSCASFISLGTYQYLTTSTASSCVSYAPVQLPHNATLTSMTCRLYDNDTTAGSNSATLYRLTSNNGAASEVFMTPSTYNSTASQSLTDSTSNISTVVDNYLYNYVLYWSSGSHNATTVGSNARFNNCTINYIYN